MLASQGPVAGKAAPTCILEVCAFPQRPPQLNLALLQLPPQPRRVPRSLCRRQALRLQLPLPRRQLLPQLCG